MDEQVKAGKPLFSHHNSTRVMGALQGISDPPEAREL
jgi:hypothetical protein